LTIKPAHISGTVMPSGRSWVSKSMQVSASNVHSKPHAAKPLAVAPKWTIA
jgi:hypothetical protein